MILSDKRKVFIVTTASHFFGVTVNEELSDEEVKVLNKFLDSSSCKTLCVYSLKNSLAFSIDFPNKENTLVFFKVTKVESISEANFHEVVQICSTGKNNGSTLVEALRQVWTPALKSSGTDASIIRQIENNILGPKLSATIIEEETLWQNKYNGTAKKDQKKLFGEAVTLLKNVRVELESAAISKDGLAGVEDALEAISGYVDDLWKLKGSIYTEERMKSLIDIIGDEVIQLIVTLINEFQDSDSRAKEESMAIGATACEKWVIISERLTGLFWPHHVLGPWKEPAYTPKTCEKFGKRLREISKLRAQHRQLTRLLTPAERAALGSDTLLDSFDELQGLCKDQNEIEWTRLKKKIEDGLTPAEDRVAGKLKAQFSSTKSPTALATEFKKYSDLLKREGLRRTLRSERESLLSVFGDLIDSCQSEPDTRELLDNPQVLQEIQTAKVTELRLQNLQILGKELLSDLPGYEETISKISVVLKETEKKRQQLVDAWIEDTKEAVMKKQLTLSADSAVVELTGTSIMKVNYDPRLATLIREARAISGYGIELSREVRSLVERASSLAGRARALQQVANFHNTIGDRMIPSQRPLMLTAALELARAVREQSGVVWSDPHAVDVYTNRLKDLVKKFASQNSELATKHITLRDLTANLLKSEAIDLAANQNAWKDTLRDMRAIVDSVEAECGNAKAWKLHWDRQLLKALGVAYRAALPSLLKKIPEIRVEITCRDGMLQWRPSLEEIRTKLYAGIRRFLAIPMNFRGVGDQADGQFHTLVQRSAYLYGGVYKEAEVALENIEALRCKWMPLASYASADIGERLKGKPPQEWEKAFKDAKQWAQKIGKLRGGEVKICCIVIDTGTTRNDLDSASRRYWERLSSDLRAEVSSRLMAVIDFLSTSSRDLDRKPRSVEEIGLAYETYSRIKTDSIEVEKELELVTGLAKILAAWTRDKLEGISEARSSWESLLERLEKHQTVMSRQMEDAKVNLHHKGLALRDEKDRWEAKWESKPEIVTLDWIALMRERWEMINQQRLSLRADCARLGLKYEDVIEHDDGFILKLEQQLLAEELSCKFQSEFLEELRKQEEEEWIVARRRIPKFYDWLESWEARVKLQTDDEKGVVNDSFVNKKIREIKACLENIQLLRGDELADEHWLELIPILKLQDVRQPRSITLGHLLNSADVIEENIDHIRDVVKKAAAESGIRQALAELEAWESATSLPLQESRDSKNRTVSLVGEYGTLLARAGELRLLLEGAKGATGFERFAAKASRCEAALFELEERLSILSAVQRKWVYLEPVYGSDAAPDDTGRWKRADKEFRYVMDEVSRDPRVPSLRRLPLSNLTNLKDLLDRCQKSLDDFLEEKRSGYPRLYFLSDEDLLELVSGSEKGLQSHLRKLYQGVAAVEIVNGKLTGVISSEEEILKFTEPVSLNDVLSLWLQNLEESIRKALKLSLDKCLGDSNPDPSSYPAQILLLAERIRFTERCETSIKSGSQSLQKLIDYLETQRARYRGLEDAGDELTALKARGLLLDTVHHLKIARTILDVLSDNEKVTWAWRKQLRSYKHPKGAVIRCADAEFLYNFEYQGVATGLVQTSLTDRCFLSLTQAMKLGLGGSPTGPAGTGKTESVKALGAILGRHVLVFNCDEGMDAGSMRRILGGLAQAGSWGCFDEFNRLEEETMSSVAMLIRPLQQAIRDNATTVQFGEQTLKLNPCCCIFITMNPADSDYGGRHKLPDSLARLFRSIGMAHPEKREIVRTLLECAGFLETSVLANQLVETFDISEKLLSKQFHYDWGLRAIKSVLNAIPPANQSSNVDERARLLVGIKSSTIPRLIEEDAVKFNRLLKDVFAKTNVTNSTSGVSKNLREVLERLCKSLSLSSKVVEQCLQLNDQLQNRCGVAVVGPPSSGKTLIRKILAEALTITGKAVSQKLIYPGAIAKTKLLGNIDAQTREWKEGLLSRAVSSGSEAPLWIILDGDVVPEWAEALNSALDDNRLLTLSNGVGIKLASGIRFVFETHELSSASPATVSRLGIVHLGSVEPKSLLTSVRINALPSAARDVTANHLGDVVNKALDGNDQRAAFNLVDAVLLHLKQADTSALVLYAYVIAVCGQIEDQSSRDQTANFIYQRTDSRCPDAKNPCSVLYNKSNDRLEPFSDNCPIVYIETGPVYYTGTLQQGTAAVLPWIESQRSIIVRGPPSCGKKTLISNALSLIKNSESVSIIKSSSLYSVQDLTTRLKRACVRFDSSSSGRLYRPKSGTRLVLILEDLHLASENLKELVRQLIKEEGFYEDDLEFAKIPVTVICTADVSTKIHPRLSSLLACYYMPNLSSREIMSIADLNLRNTLKDDHSLMESWVPKIVPGLVEAFKVICNSSHLVSLKDLVFWCRSLKYYSGFENSASVTSCLINAGRQLFSFRLGSKNRYRWETLITARVPANPPKDEEYIWKDGPHFLLQGMEEWKSEVHNAVSRLAREGEPIETLISSHLLNTAAGLNWALGCKIPGVILIGRPGAGRKSATRIIASLNSHRLINLGPGKGRAAVKAAIQTSGIEGEPTLLLLEEHHIREDGLAVLVNGIVCRGEVPGLLSSDETDGLIAPLAELARREDFAGSAEQYFHHRVRSLLRVIIIVDVNDVGQDWLVRSNLLRHCLLYGNELRSEWWHQQNFLTSIALEKSELDNEEENSGIKELVAAHLQAPISQQAPARFWAMIEAWKNIRRVWVKEIEFKLQSLQAGISKLKEAGDRVAKLEEEASKQRQELEAEKGRANAALEQITATMRGATGQRGEMTNLKAETEKESAELARRKVDIESELGKVEPLVEQAAQAVAGISSDALSEVRSLRAPPAPVRDVLEGVLRLMGIRDTSWNSMKTFLAKRGIKDEIRNWDARRSTAVSLEAVEKLVKERPESFEEKTARRASVAAAPLAAWVLANLKYGQVLQMVAPLEKEQRQLAQRLAAAEAELGRLATGLNTVESRVAQLQEQLAEHSRGAAALQLRTEATETSLATARTLLHKLDAEHLDWQREFEQLKSRKSTLGVQAANVASLLVYKDSTRDDKWKKTAIDLLITEREILQWRTQGLPADTTSLAGAACALRGPLVPMFIDSSGIAVSWLKSNLENLEKTAPEDPKFVTTVELAVRFGKPLLVEDIVDLPPILLPLLKHRPLRLGDRILPIQQGFKLFLSTRKDRLDNVPSEADAILIYVSLGSDTSSLAERFIEKAILRETPELDSERREALRREEKLKGESEEARLELLERLGAANSQDLLQDSQGSQGGLLASLETTQAKAKEITKALEESRHSLEEHAKRFQAHEKLATLAAKLYKIVKAFSSSYSLYVFSTEAFSNIYLEAEANRSSFKSNDEKETDKALEKRLIVLTLHHCLQAFYRQHRLSLALHIALALNPVPEAEKKLLLNLDQFNHEDTVDFNIPDFVPEDRKIAVKALANVIPQIMTKLSSTWLDDITNIYADRNLSSFQRVLTIQSLRPDHLYTALAKWTSDHLGVRDLNPPSWTLKKVAEEDAAAQPVLLLLASGADPGPELNNIANEQGSSVADFVEISLGQGQLNQAETALESACRRGGWILLSNLQLALNWLPRLEVILRSPMCTTEKHENTRIWLTTEECTGFYPGLAGLCLKLAYEPPEGVKRNFKRSLQLLKQRKLQDPKKTVQLAWLHAILQERRRFVPQGWIKAYDWSEADLEAACELVVKESKSNDDRGEWESGRELLDVSIYGGRLQDNYDLRALKAILRVIWSKEVYKGNRKLGEVIDLQHLNSGNVLQVIDRLDNVDLLQEYFGLPANANRSWEKSAVEAELALLKEIIIKSSKRTASGQQKRVQSTDTKTQRDLKNLMIQRIKDIKLLTRNDSIKDSPLDSFLNDERTLAVKLLKMIQNNLEHIELNNTKTPREWLLFWPDGPKEAIPFISKLIFRHKKLTSSSLDLLDCVDLSWFMRPRAYFAALKQHFARKLDKPLENLEIRVNWSGNRSQSGEKMVLIEGLFLTGATIQEGMLKEVSAEAAPVSATPECRLTYVSKDDAVNSGEKWNNIDQDDESDSSQLTVPVYSNSSRKTLIFTLPVGYSQTDKDTWLRRGVMFHLKSE